MFDSDIWSVGNLLFHTNMSKVSATSYIDSIFSHGLWSYLHTLRQDEYIRHKNTHKSQIRFDVHMYLLYLSDQ